MTTALSSRLALAVSCATLLLSAALMFALQPMVGKMLLPLVGGTPAGWIVTMAFFQAMLLAGYFLAHALSRFSPRLHGALYVACLGAGCFFLPVALDGAAAGFGPFDIFALLASAVAVPFVAISATSSTVQRLFMTTGHPAAGDPYFLYAASNLGSFLGLFLYPLAFEPAWGLSAQAQHWLYGFTALIGLAVLCLAFSGRAAEGATQPGAAAPVTNAQRRGWVLLSFLPSALLLAVSTHITTEVFSAPLIWVMPLAIYLLTFVIAFSRAQFFGADAVARAQRVAVPAAIALTCVYNFNIRISVYTMFFHLFAFGIAALACHMLLAARRPSGGGRQLTEFYLMTAIGGALGGALNAFILPVVLDRLAEYPVLLALSLCVHPSFRKPLEFAPRMILWLAGFFGFMLLLFVRNKANFVIPGNIGEISSGMFVADVILFIIALMLATSLRAAFWGGLAMVLMFELVIPRDVVVTTRNFYGMIKVFDREAVIGGKAHKARYMYHGTTTHGLQIVSPEHERTPTAYFWSGGPAGDVFSLYNPKDIAVLGLGAGTFNCYSTPDRAFTFFEIDPAVKRVAEEQFTFLSACKGRTPPEIIIGDGRLEIAKLEGRRFDLIVLDAFSSDTIPVHLLTYEAVKAYLERLGERGLLLFNLSNRYFMLAPPLARIAQELGLKTRLVLDLAPPEVTYAADSLWMVMAREDVSLSPLDDFRWIELPPPADERLWTDDYSNLLKTMTFYHDLASARWPKGLEPAKATAPPPEASRP